jgi:hypothetical protein
MKLEFLDSLSKNTEISNFMKIRPVGTELFLRTDRHDELIVTFAILRTLLKMNESVIWRQRCLCVLHEDICGSGGLVPLTFKLRTR